MRTETRLVDGQPVPLLVSAVIPGEFAHGFTMRAGGVSEAPFDSLNLGYHRGDQRERVLENRRRVQRWLDVQRLFFARQVHGADVVQVGPAQSPDEVAGLPADGLHTDVVGVAIGVFTADCVPLLLADPRTGACAAVHAGWRGVIAGVASAAIRALGERHGSRPQDVRVAVGPCIGLCCFEVGPEVAAAFVAARPPAGGAGVVQVRADGRPGHPYVDLRRALSLELADRGVSADHVEISEDCTRCDPERRFYSYRADAGRTGAQMAVIARRPG